MSSWIVNYTNIILDIINNTKDTSISNNAEKIITETTLVNEASMRNAILTTAYNVLNSLPNEDVSTNTTGTVESDTSYMSGLYSWDPRLQRVEGFISGKNDKHPIIIPFASNTAASAYYNMVFSLENAVLKEISKQDNESSAESTSSGNTNTTADKNITTNSAADRVVLGDENYINNVKGYNDLYGVASVVNPYTLTKLCGSLQVNNDADGVTTKSNRLYDIRNNKRFYDKNVSTENDYTTINNPTTTNIITWSNTDPWGRTPYSFLDFVFCKYWNIIPNNRLITLRKYHAPVYDNLLFPSMYNSDGSINKDIAFAPIATVLTYFGELTGNTMSNLISFTTGTNWKDIKADIHEVTGDTGDDPRARIDQMFTNGNGFTGAESSIFKNIVGKSNWLTGKMFSFGKFVGLLDKDGYDIKKDLGVFEKLNTTNMDPYDLIYSNRIKGPVNRIDSTKARDAGIVFDLTFNLTFEYVSRPIGGINSKAVLLDILSNCMEIASPEAAFWGGGYKWMIFPHMYPFKNTHFKNSIMDALYSGRIFGSDGALAQTLDGIKSLGTSDDGSGSFDWSNVLSNIASFLGEGLGAVGSLLSDVGSSIFGEGNMLSSLIDKGTTAMVGESNKEAGESKSHNLLNNINSMWRAQVVLQTMMPQLNNMRALLTGEPVGNWHLVVGNPLNPIMTIGNLICTKMLVNVSDELGPDDFPVEIKIVYSLEHGMAREKGSIQSMFNRGNGKIYELPDFIRASSDYESKVDNFTGNTSKAGWGNPKFMSIGEMLNANGGSGGYKQVKLKDAETTAINANTDNTIITKFTPIDINLATTTIDNRLSSFGDNNYARVWIRGTAATRKLMN